MARVYLAAAFDVIARAPYEHWRRRNFQQAQNHRREQRMHSFYSDLRFAIRSFARQPGATALVVITLALAVGANTAVFALVDAVFFRPLPYPNANRLVDLNETAPKWGLDFTSINYPDFDQWRKASRSFEAMALWSGSSFNVSDGTSAERLTGQYVTYDMPLALGIRPVLGRSFTREEDVPKGPNVVMISYGLWQTRFGGARDVLGKSLRISSLPYTIIGVLPPNVTLDGQTSLWLPLGGDPKQVGQSYAYDGVARLKPGVTIEQARRDLEIAHEPIWRASDTTHTVSPRIMPLRDRFVSEYRTIGAALGAGVVLVLLIACANVAGAMLARSMFRRREMGIRIALGASNSRLTRQVMTESLLLATLGGIVGTLLGRTGIGLLTAGVETPPPWLHLGIDARAVAFSVLIVAVTAILFGLVPSIPLRRQGQGALAATGSRTAGSVPERRVLNGLVVVEIALAAVLLASGGLLMRAYSNLRDVDPGFRPDGVVGFRVSLPEATYQNGLVQRRFYETLIASLRAVPGVIDAGVVTCAPFTCHWGSFFAAEGAPAKPANAVDPVVLLRYASAGYFQTMGIKLLRGRFFDEHEGAPQGLRPVVINDVLEKQLWPDGSNSVGKRFSNRGDTAASRKMTVVGVVKDVRHYGLARPMIGGLYRSMTAVDSANGLPSLAVVAHTSGSTSALFASIRTTMRELDPELPLYDMKTMQAAVDQSVASRRAIALWLAAFAAIASVGGRRYLRGVVVRRRPPTPRNRYCMALRCADVAGPQPHRSAGAAIGRDRIGDRCAVRASRVPSTVESSRGRHGGRPAHLRRRRARSDRDGSDRGMDSGAASSARRSEDRVQRRIIALPP
jgi:putative ABC transport system permease protein